MGSLVFAKGDLVHVPQAVIMYGGDSRSAKIYVNQKPTLAIFIEYSTDGMSSIVMDGQKWLVKNNQIFLNREAE